MIKKVKTNQIMFLRVSLNCGKKNIAGTICKITLITAVALNILYSVKLTLTVSMARGPFVSTLLGNTLIL